MSKNDEYVYERCLIEVAPVLKKRGMENYEKTAANICRMRVDEGVFTEDRNIRSFAGDRDGTQRTFALELGDPTNTDDFIEYPVVAITSGPHDESGDQKVFIEPSILEKNVSAFAELPVYFNHQRTDDDLLGTAINPELVDMDDGKKAIKMLARIHKDAAKANEVLEKIENGDMTHVSIDWFSKDIDVLGEPFATDIRPIEVSFIDNETRTPVCEACTIEGNEKKCDEHREFGEDSEKSEDCSCGSTSEACACDTHGTHSEEITMAEEIVEKASEESGIVEREFAAMKDQLSEMKTSYNELNAKHEEALAMIAKFEEDKEKAAEAEAEARKSNFVNTIIEKEALLGKVEDDTKEARVSELTSWDEVKLEGFSIAMESMPVPEEAERTFGKGKAHEDTEQPVETEAEETPRMFAMENGRIVYTGEEKGE
tara:strand:+ start:578 stop:1861 length:1284 start_codon:yes stop_codon:yes gene_type:complete